MSIIKIHCRGEPIFINKQDLETEDEEWFLPLLLKYEKKSNDPTDIIEVYIGEERNLVLSVIETIRYKKYIVYNNIPVSLMEALCDKWCCPEWITLLIKEQKEKEETTNTRSIDHLDNYFLKCELCNTGFKISENKKDSCKSHKQSYSSITNNYPCCGNDPKKEANVWCCVGYHVPLSQLIV